MLGQSGRSVVPKQYHIHVKPHARSVQDCLRNLNPSCHLEAFLRNLNPSSHLNTVNVYCLFCLFCCKFTLISTLLVISQQSVHLTSFPGHLTSDHQFLYKWPTTNSTWFLNQRWEADNNQDQLSQWNYASPEDQTSNLWHGRVVNTSD